MGRYLLSLLLLVSGLLMILFSGSAIDFHQPRVASFDLLFAAYDIVCGYFAWPVGGRR